MQCMREEKNVEVLLIISHVGTTGIHRRSGTRIDVNGKSASGAGAHGAPLGHPPIPSRKRARPSDPGLLDTSRMTLSISPSAIILAGNGLVESRFLTEFQCRKRTTACE